MEQGTGSLRGYFGIRSQQDPPGCIPAPGILELEPRHERVVRRRNRQRAAADTSGHHAPQQRDAERGALGRVRAGAQLVQKDQGLPVRLGAQSLSGS